MLDDKLAKIVAGALIATFVFGGIACYPAFLLSPAGEPALFAYSGSEPAGDTPADEDGGQPLPRSPLAEDISDRPLSELIHPLLRGVALRSRGLGALHPSEPSSLYSVHCSSELLRPPQI